MLMGEHLISWNGFILFGGFVGVMMGVGRIARGIQIRNVMLSAFLLCVGFLQIVSALFHSDQIHRYPFLFLTMIPVVMLAGPLLFGLYSSLFSENHFLKRGSFLHLLPAFVTTLYLLWKYSDVNALVPLIERHQAHGELDEFRLLLICGVGLVLLYLTYCIFRLSLFWNQTRDESRRGGTILAVVYFLFGLLALVGLAANARVLVQAINIGTSGLFLGLYFAEQKFPDVMNTLALAVKKRREQSHLKSVDLPEIHAKLLSLMENEKPFCDEDITLPGLARLVGISAHQLSEFLNEHLDQNFNRFINDYRVREAKSLLVDEPGRSILSVGLAVGFNSTSAFHHSFRTHTGVTPARFRKSALGARKIPKS